MDTVECPTCTLRFEPDDTRFDSYAEIFCPQCGNEFSAASETETEAGSVSAEAA